MDGYAHNWKRAETRRAAGAVSGGVGRTVVGLLIAMRFSLCRDGLRLGLSEFPRVLQLAESVAEESREGRVSSALLSWGKFYSSAASGSGADVILPRFCGCAVVFGQTGWFCRTPALLVRRRLGYGHQTL